MKKVGTQPKKKIQRKRNKQNENENEKYDAIIIKENVKYTHTHTHEQTNRVPKSLDSRILDPKYNHLTKITTTHKIDDDDDDYGNCF